MGLTDDHDVLTDQGWVNISHLTTDNYVATLNPLNKSLEWHKPITLYQYNDISDMYNVVDANVDVCMTLSQPLYVSADNKAWQLSSGSVLANNTSPSFLTSAMANTQATVANYTFNGTAKTVAMNKWLPFLGLYLRYGSVFNQSGNLINLSSMAIEQLASIVNGLNYELRNDVQIKIMSYNIDSNGLANTIIHLPDFVMNDLTSMSGLPSWCLHLGATQMALLLCDNLLPSVPFTTSNKNLIDSLQAAYLLAGKPMVVNQLQGGLYYLAAQIQPTTVNQSISNFVGYVHELSVQNFVFMARRHGKPVLI